MHSWTQILRTIGCLLIAVAWLPCVVAADAPPPRATLIPALAETELYTGWLKMYDLRFDEAHRVFAQWRQTNPKDPMGHVSDAAAYLFSELARLGILQSEFFTDDATFLSGTKLTPDLAARRSFLQQVDQADRLSGDILKQRPSDAGALLAKALSLGLRANYAALLDRQYLSALSYTKQARDVAEKLILVDPQAFDGYVCPGIEHYLLSLKAAPVRWVLRLTGSHIDAEKGLAEVRQAAAKGHYLEPFAKLLLAVAALRENRRDEARNILTELRTRFPHNDLYARELGRLTAQR